MTMTKAEQPTITQADRDAAAEMWITLGTVQFVHWQADWMRDGTADNGPVVQAFARHRIAEQSASCDLGVGCDEAGVCYAKTNGKPEMCHRTTSLAAQDGLVEALEYARSQIIGLAVSGTDRIDELCRKLQKMDPSPIWPIPFPDPPERTWQPIVKRIDEALSAIKGDKS